jgi:hypothetical protein
MLEIAHYKSWPREPTGKIVAAEQAVNVAYSVPMKGLVAGAA